MAQIAGLPRGRLSLTGNIDFSRLKVIGSENMEVVFMSKIRKSISFGSMATVLLAGCVLLSGGMGWSAQQTTDQMVLAQQAAQGKAKKAKAEGPLTEKELIKLVKHNKKHLNTAEPEIEARGLGFEMTPEVETQLQKAGADEAFIANLKGYTPSARVEKAKSTGPQVSQAEANAYNQLKAETDPDKRIQEANTFALNFPNSTLLSYVYAIQAVAYQEKNDPPDVIAAGEKSLELNPDNVMALLLLSSTLPQPQLLNVSDAEKVKRLNTAENYATKALQQIDKIGKQPNETDAAFQQRKDQMASGVYSSLGMVHLERSRMAIQAPDQAELGRAEQSYKTAIEKSKGSENAVDYYRLGEVYSMEDKLDEAISAFSNAKRLAPGSVIEQYADRDIKNLKEKKSQAKTPKS